MTTREEDLAEADRLDALISKLGPRNRVLREEQLPQLRKRRDALQQAGNQTDADRLTAVIESLDARSKALSKQLDRDFQRMLVLRNRHTRLHRSR